MTYLNIQPRNRNAKRLVLVNPKTFVHITDCHNIIIVKRSVKTNKQDRMPHTAISLLSLLTTAVMVRMCSCSIVRACFSSCQVPCVKFRLSITSSFVLNARSSTACEFFSCCAIRSSRMSRREGLREVARERGLSCTRGDWKRVSYSGWPFCCLPGGGNVSKSSVVS